MCASSDLQFLASVFLSSELRIMSNLLSMARISSGVRARVVVSRKLITEKPISKFCFAKMTRVPSSSSKSYSAIFARRENLGRCNAKLGSWILLGSVRSFAQMNDNSCRNGERALFSLARGRKSREMQARCWRRVEWSRVTFRAASLPQRRDLWRKRKCIHITRAVSVYCRGIRAVVRYPSKSLFDFVRCVA